MIGELRLRIDVNPLLGKTIDFAEHHPNVVRWVSVRLLAWTLCRLFVRVSLK